MRLLFFVLLCLLGLCHGNSLNNPLSSLMEKDASEELKAFTTLVLNTVSTHVAFSAIGLPPTLDDFKNDLANITVAFWLLPLRDQKLLLKNFKAYGETARQNKSLPMDADLELLDNRMNSAPTRLLLETIDRTCNWLEEHTRCLGLVREKDPALAKVIEKFIEDGTQQYKKLNSQDGKDFVFETVDYLCKNKDKNDDEKMSDETWTHIKENFAKLSHSDKVDVVRKMTWFLDPVWERIHSMVVAVPSMRQLHQEQ